MGASFFAIFAKGRMSLYSEFLADAKEMTEDFGVAGTAGSLSFYCLLSDPLLDSRLESGGFVQETMHTVRLPAVSASWTFSDGSTVGSSGATYSGSTPVASLLIGKKIVAGGKNLRITAYSYKPGSAWVSLNVVHEDQ